MDTYVFKVNVFTKLAKYEYNTVFVSSFCVFNTLVSNVLFWVVCCRSEQCDEVRRVERFENGFILDPFCLYLWFTALAVPMELVNCFSCLPI